MLTLADRFDLILSNATLHWILDHRFLLVNVYDHLTNAGVARFNFAGEGNCASVCRVVREVMRQDKYQPYFQGFGSGLGGVWRPDAQSSTASAIPVMAADGPLRWRLTRLSTRPVAR
jgi:trans-aconitate methyltransferase